MKLLFLLMIYPVSLLVKFNTFCNKLQLKFLVFYTFNIIRGYLKEAYVFDDVGNYKNYERVFLEHLPEITNYFKKCTGRKCISVVCDETNNTPETISKGLMNVDLYFT